MYVAFDSHDKITGINRKRNGFSFMALLMSG
jgi:hypothetical protein